jgi:hypothetical protein
MFNLKILAASYFHAFNDEPFSIRTILNRNFEVLFTKTLPNQQFWHSINFTFWSNMYTLKRFLSNQITQNRDL